MKTLALTLDATDLLHIRTALRAEIDAVRTSIVDRVGRGEFTSAQNLHGKLTELQATLQKVRAGLIETTDGRLNG